MITYSGEHYKIEYDEEALEWNGYVKALQESLIQGKWIKVVSHVEFKDAVVWVLHELDSEIELKLRELNLVVIPDETPCHTSQLKQSVLHVGGDDGCRGGQLVD